MARVEAPVSASPVSTTSNAAHVTPKITLGGGGNPDQKRETPSLFRPRTPVEEVKEEKKSPLLEDRHTPFGEAQVQAAWTAYKEMRIANKASDTEKLVLARRLSKGAAEHSVKILLESQLEVSILEKFESDLIQFLRKTLDNTNVLIEREISEIELTKSLYTSRDKFEYMLQKNAALKDLQERLGLDFDY